MFFFISFKVKEGDAILPEELLKNANSEATAYLYIYKSIYIFPSDYLKFSLFFNNLGRKKLSNIQHNNMFQVLTFTPWVKQHNDFFRMLVTKICFFFYTRYTGLGFHIKVASTHDGVRWRRYLKAHTFLIGLHNLCWPCAVHIISGQTHWHPDNGSFTFLWSIS